MNNLFLNNIKDDLIIILKEKSLSPVDIDSLSINYRTNLDEQMAKYLKLLREQGELLSIAKNESNETLALSALLKLRTHAMSLSSFFDSIVEDTETIIRLDTWPEISEE